MSERPDTCRLLQLFNRSLGTGGEELAVRLVGRMLAGACDLRECWFQSAEWTGPGAPPAWRQAAWMYHHPRALELIRTAHREAGAEAWILHNFIPVISGGVYALARQERVPIIQFVHNFRPFSVNSYAWTGRNLDPANWRTNFLREIWHGSWQGSRLKTAWLAGLLATLHARRSFRAVKAWVAVSEFMRTQFIAAGVAPEDIFTLRHAWTPLAKAPTVADAGHYLFLGRLIEEKGVKVLVATWQRLREQLAGGCPRLVIGGDGPLAEWVKNETRSNPQIEYRGVVAGDEKRDLLAGCRALIVPSVWWEPLGLVVYEAYDYGKPVLAAASGGLAELVQDGVTGRQHRAGDSAELAAHIRELDAAPARRVELGAAGRNWLLANTGEGEWKRRFFEIVAHAKRPRQERRAWAGEIC